MALDDLLEVYAWNSIFEVVKAVGGFPVFLGGERTSDPEVDSWVVVWPLVDAQKPARRDVRRGNLLVQVNCHSRFEEGRADRDLLAPWKLAAVVKALLTDKDVPVNTFNVDPEVNLGQLNVHKPSTVYVPRPHRLMRAGTSGSDPFEQPEVHSVVLTYAATFVAA